MLANISSFSKRSGFARSRDGAAAQYRRHLYTAGTRKNFSLSEENLEGFPGTVVFSLQRRCVSRPEKMEEVPGPDRLKHDKS